MNKQFEWVDKPSPWAFPVARPGLPFIYASAFLTLIVAISDMPCLTLLLIFITFCIVMFFRDPDRITPNQDNAVISPADGKVIKAETIQTSPYLDAPCIKISIFMTVFNVHVNRIPCSGTVADVIYHPGQFVSANLDKASEKTNVMQSLSNWTMVNQWQLFKSQGSLPDELSVRCRLVTKLKKVSVLV
ncbi:MAG: phosphatidylserine decarboxylase [Candidatus Magnetoglobus multicellularis str. Araruama]|uniref:Phosphatidylserine decarboxylase n=1 Tax=Candidatus Magnetoglobus multicellularis str. Araruama TaxID=890399 RepID=A0A1V1PDV3_9BACT|nr:MAG: phosphatidylserine decarboxylase [Candidatus Magnetoglobus multicellularis str. Araruama]